MDKRDFEKTVPWKTVFIYLAGAIGLVAGVAAFINQTNKLISGDKDIYRISSLVCTDGDQTFNFLTIKTTYIGPGNWCTYPLEQTGNNTWSAVRTCFINYDVSCRTEATEGRVKASELEFLD